MPVGAKNVALNPMLDRLVPPWRKAVWSRAELVGTNSLEITARSEDDSYIMGLRHREFPMESVQFHPESIATEGGMQLIRNFLQMRAPFT